MVLQLLLTFLTHENYTWCTKCNSFSCKVTGVRRMLGDNSLLKSEWLYFKGFNISSFPHFHHLTDRPSVRYNTFMITWLCAKGESNPPYYSLSTRCLSVTLHIKMLKVRNLFTEEGAFNSQHYDKHCKLNSTRRRVSTIWKSIKLFVRFFKPLWAKQVNRQSAEALFHLNLCPSKSSTWRF